MPCFAFLCAQVLHSIMDEDIAKARYDDTILLALFFDVLSSILYLWSAQIYFFSRRLCALLLKTLSRIA